jgi:hypothetical protein
MRFRQRGSSTPGKPGNPTNPVPGLRLDGNRFTQYLAVSDQIWSTLRRMAELENVDWWIAAVAAATRL